MNAKECIQADQINNEVFKFNPIACSAYARNVAKDFNPIHSHLTKNYCVPGDLIFALVAELHSASSYMRLDFVNRVGADCNLFFESRRKGLVLVDAAEKVYAELVTDGAVSVCAESVTAIASAVVSCTSSYFPYKLVDMLRANNMMLSLRRSLIMLKSIEVDMKNIHAISTLASKFKSSNLELSGQRGVVRAHFELLDDGGIIVGSVTKTVLIVGLEEYNEKNSEQFINDYEGLVRSQHQISSLEMMFAV